ncbi:hypothetical protein NUE67_RS26335, partial [Escherichia coli]
LDKLISVLSVSRVHKVNFVITAWRMGAVFSFIDKLQIKITRTRLVFKSSFGFHRAYMDPSGLQDIR